ncbi:MAG: 30S ribosomal protein S16 [Candidatus Chisholmbacteria bacterium]|nr:30S ribosomal protein S16 [Candidatus Chisholmbacteria bacterium]
MLKIRLTRTGKRGQPSYRVVVKERRSKRDGGSVEILGTYDPLPHPSLIHLNVERYHYWLSKGALPSPTVQSLVTKLKAQKG